jgi:uncharacterized protein YgbK (DUF1537 family)
VVDACSDTDLEQLSLAINKMPSDVGVLPCGSAGCAKALSHKWVVHAPHPTAPIPTVDPSPLLMVIGTASPITRHQVRLFEAQYADLNPDGRLHLAALTPAQILGLVPTDDIISEIGQSLANNATVILSIAMAETTLSQTLTLAEEHDLSPAKAFEKAATCLAHITQTILQQFSVKLLLSGGETATAICKALSVRFLQVAYPLETSIPLLIDDQARWIITKSGGFGREDCLITLFRTLQQMERRAVGTGHGR